MTTRMHDDEYFNRVKADRAVWWGTHDVWIVGLDWYTGDPHHRHRYGAGYGKGLPTGDIEDDDRELADLADAMIRAAETAGAVEHGDLAPQCTFPFVWTVAHLRGVLEVRRG